MKKYYLLLLLLGFVTAALAQSVSSPSHPFRATTTTATNGLINDPLALDYYQYWKKHYLKKASNNELLVKNDETQEGGRTTSEASGYGMLIEVIMAGKDPDAQANFDALYRYVRAHHVKLRNPTDTLSPYLMSWKQYRLKSDEDDSAVDGDLDIAYALLLANSQWHNGDFNYLDCAKHTIDAIKALEMDTIHYRFLRGNSDNDHTFLSQNVIRLSDFMPDHFRAFAAAMHDDFWTKLRLVSYHRYYQIQQQFSDAYGLFPEYVLLLPQGKYDLIPDSVAAKAHQEGFDDGGGAANPLGRFYGFNSCRIPWRMAVDYELNKDDTALLILKRFNSGMKTYAAKNPCYLTNVFPLKDSNDQASHILSIKNRADTATADINVVAPICAGLMIEGDSDWKNVLQHRMLDDKQYYNCETDPRHLPKRHYYEYTLRVLSLLLITHHYWQPTVN